MTIRKQPRRTIGRGGLAAAVRDAGGPFRGRGSGQGPERISSVTKRCRTLSSDGSASFRARIAKDEHSFDWELNYTGLTG